MYYTSWATSAWLTFWDQKRSGKIKSTQKLCVDKEIYLNYFTVKNFPKLSLRISVRMYNRTNSKNIAVDSKEANELREVFNMFLEDVDSEWQKKER